MTSHQTGFSGNDCHTGKMHCHHCGYLGKYDDFDFIGIDLALCPKCGKKTGDCNVL